MIVFTWSEAVFVTLMAVVALALLAWGMRDDAAPQAAPDVAPPDDLSPFERVVEQARRRLPKGIADELDRRRVVIVVMDSSPDQPADTLAAYLGGTLRTMQIYQDACEAHATDLPLDELVFRVLLDQAAVVIPELDRKTFKPLYRDPA